MNTFSPAASSLQRRTVVGGASPRRAGRAHRGDGGFTLLEVLVAVLVLSLGLLGIAALQASTVQFNHAAYLRSQATSLAYDIVDRMRTNRNAALDGEYDAGFQSPAPACGSVTGGGSIAAEDLAEWRNALACALPSGTGRVEVDGDGVVTISVRWDESRGEGTDGTIRTFEMTTGL